MARPTFFSRAAGALEAAVRAYRSAEVSRVADVPGVTAWGQRSGDAETRRALESMGVYESRLAPLAGPTQTRWALWNGDGLTPEYIIRAQREAVSSGIPLTWVELIDQVYSRDGHYASVTDQRVSDVIKGTWRLTAPIADPLGLATANFLDEAYRNCSRWSDGLGWLLYANLYGYNAVEVEWHETTVTFQGPRGETIGPVDVVLPKKLHAVHPKHFRFDLATDDPRFWIKDGYQELPLGKFVFMDGCGLHPIKVRHGHAWQCIWYSLFRSAGWSAWATHVDRFSLPVPIIEYEGDVAQYNEYKAAYLDILNSLGQGKGAIVPKGGANFRIDPPPPGGRSDDPASALSDACDAGQSIRVLGATLTNKIGNVGSFAASETHVDVKYGLEELDGARAWERVDEQLSAPCLLFNAEAIARALNAAGYNVTPQQVVRRVPKGKHHIPGKTDPLQEMQILDYAVNKLSMPISLSGTFARMDFQRARDEKDRIRGEAQPVAKGGALMTADEATQPGGAVNPDVAAEKTADTAAKEAAKPAAEKQSTPADDK